MSTERSVECILLVEDDRDYCQLLHQAFAEAGFRTVRADNGEQALELLRREPVDLIVSDFIMPELNGLELCRLVNEDLQFSKVKVILYSCNPDATFRRKARELGALDYLPKTDTETLVRQVCELAGLQNHPTPTTAAASGNSRHDDLLRELRLLFDDLLDFIQIAAVAEPPSPAGRLACESAQRLSGDIKRILKEMEELRS